MDDLDDYTSIKIQKINHKYGKYILEYCCEKCGKPYHEHEMYLSKPDYIYCPYCGRKIKND